MSYERKLRRKAAREGKKKMSENGKLVAVGPKVATQAARLMETIRHNTDQLNAFLAGARAALDLSEDWRFDAGLMAFCPPPSRPEPEQPETETEEISNGE